VEDVFNGDSVFFLYIGGSSFNGEVLSITMVADEGGQRRGTCAAFARKLSVHDVCRKV
jgi:hypothetical protein